MWIVDGSAGCAFPCRNGQCTRKSAENPFTPKWCDYYFPCCARFVCNVSGRFVSIKIVLSIVAYRMLVFVI